MLKLFFEKYKGVVYSIVVSLLLLYGVQYYLFYTDVFQRYSSFVGGEVVKSMMTSKKKSDNRTLLIGDSVAKQLYGTGIDSAYTTLACNQAISMAGHYLLMRDYCDSNKVDTVILIYHPLSFQNDLDQIYAYQYFLKNFYTEENKKRLIERTKELIELIPLSCVCQFPLIRMSNFSPRYDYKKEIDVDDFSISNTSKTYLRLMKEYCDVNKIYFKVVAPPVREGLSNSISLMLREPNLRCQHGELFDAYYQTIQYLPDSFYKDTLHLCRDRIGEAKRLMNEWL